MNRHLCALLLVCLAVAGCEGGPPTSSTSATSKPSSAPSSPAQAPAATAQATAASASDAPAATNLTPGTYKASAAKFYGKPVSGEAVLYEFETGTLNGKPLFRAYLADDEQKKNSIQCELDADPKLPKNTRVTFEGQGMGAGSIDKCKLAKK